MPAPAVGPAVDRRYLAVLGVSVLAHAAAVTALALRPALAEAEPSWADMPDRFRIAMLPALARRPVPPAATPRATARPAPSDAATGGRAPKAREESMQAAVGRALRWVGSEGEGVGGLAFDDLWHGGGSRDMDEALRGARNAGEAADVLSPVRRQDGATEPARLDGFATGGVKEFRLDGGSRGAGPSPLIRETPPIVESGRCDREVVRDFVRRRLRSLQGCYERVLKRLPSLRGKLTFRLVIGPDGRAGEVEVDEDTLDNEDVSACMRAAIRFWVLPIRGQECPVVLPIVLQPTG